MHLIINLLSAAKFAGQKMLREKKTTSTPQEISTNNE